MRIIILLVGFTKLPSRTDTNRGRYDPIPPGPLKPPNVTSYETLSCTVMIEHRVCTINRNQNDWQPVDLVDTPSRSTMDSYPQKLRQRTRRESPHTTRPA